MQPIAYLNSVFTARVQIEWLWRPDIVWLLVAWELTMVVLAVLFPVAMLELSFGMLALPILLFVLAPNNRSIREESPVDPKPTSVSAEVAEAASSSSSSASTRPQLEIGVQMRSLLSCLGLIFAINLLPLIVQVSPGLIEACTVVMFVVLGHILLSKTALVHSHLQAQKLDKGACSMDDTEELCPTTMMEAPQEVARDTYQPEDEKKENEWQGDKELNEPIDSTVLLADLEYDEEVDEQEDVLNLEEIRQPSKESKEEEVVAPTRSKLVWADVEEDEFQLSLAQNQPEYTNHTPDAAGEDDSKEGRPEGARSSKGKGKGKGKGGGKGAQEVHDKSPAAPFTMRIRTCGRNGDLQGALAVVKEAMASGLESSTEVQNALLFALVHCGELAGAADLFVKMKDTKQADVVSFNIMLRSLLDQGLHDKAKELLQDMSEHGLTANKVTLNELLGDRVKAQDRAGMWRIVDEMKTTGFGITNVTCSLLLKALIDGTPKSEVKKTLALLNELSEPMDEALCSSAIEACLRVKELEMASEFMSNLGNLKAKTKNVGLSPATYGSMIKAHGQARDLEQTWSTWNAMFKNGTSPSAVTFGCMVEALVMNGVVDDAWKLMHDMLENQEHAECVNTVIYSTVMKGFSHARKPEQCFAVLDEMRVRGIEANTITYNTLLDACAKCSAMARVPQVFEEMKLGRIEPDKITYSTLIKGYCMVGDLDCAFDLFEEMKADSKVGLDEIVYNALIDGCGRQQKVQRAMQVLEDMRVAKITPSNYTLSIMVKLLGRAHKLNEALALMEEFQTKYRVRPNVQVYTCLMQACLLNKRVPQALTVYNNMVKDLRCLPDQKAYSVLLNGCIQAGALKEAVQVTRCAYLLPSEGLQTAEYAEHVVGVEPRIMCSIDAKLRSMDMEPDLMKDWDEAMKLSGCRSSGGGHQYSSPAGKGYGKDSGKGGKGYSKGNGKDGGKDGGKGYSKGYGKDDSRGSPKGYGKDGGKNGKDSGKSKGKGKGKFQDE